jgi:excisionase family DNA binding protein
MSRHILLHRLSCNICNIAALDKGTSIYYVGFMKPYLTANEVARLLKVDRATVTRWIRRGIISGVHRPRGTRNWRIPIAAYQVLVQQMNEGC